MKERLETSGLRQTNAGVAAGATILD